MNRRANAQHRFEEALKRLFQRTGQRGEPDITKYCCIHDAIRLLEAANARSKKLFPHFLGSAPGQAASLHFASGCGDILMEWDINHNPLRTELFKKPFEIKDGLIQIPDAPGIGWDLDFEMIEKFCVSRENL